MGRENISLNNIANINDFEITSAIMKYIICDKRVQSSTTKIAFNYSIVNDYPFYQRGRIKKSPGVRKLVTLSLSVRFS
jgi:hypothetical protein